MKPFDEECDPGEFLLELHKDAIAHSVSAIAVVVQYDDGRGETFTAVLNDDMMRLASLVDGLEKLLATARRHKEQLS